MRYLAASVCIVSLGLANVSFGFIAAPEIDPATGVSALTVLSGGLLLLFGRRKTK